MPSADCHWWSLIESGREIAAKQVSALELTTAMLARIDRVDTDIASYQLVCHERAIEHARRMDAALARGSSRGPLHGVPIAVKALCDIEGLPSAAGTELLSAHIPACDATVVQRLQAAGAVLLGTLKMTEGASAVHHPSVEPPRNPWDRGAWTGASSSGSGAALAAGLCFGALGSDTAGSIRVPSHFCGVTGLKPTYGRVSRAGVFALCASLDHVGPMARSAADCAALLHAIAGADARDPSAHAARVPDYLADIEQSLRGMRVGFDERYACEGVDPQLAAAVRTAGQALADAGAVIVPIQVPDRTPALTGGAHILHADVAYAHASLFPGNEHRYGAHLREIIEIGQRLSGTDLARAHDLARTWNGQLAALLTGVDAILCPPTLTPAPPAHLTTALPGDFRTQGKFLGFTLPYTVSGSPCLTVPCGFNSRGLPLAFQLVGRHFDESTLLRAGHQFQRLTDWHTRHPCV